MKHLTLLAILSMTAVNAQESPLKKLPDTLKTSKTYSAKKIDSLRMKSMMSQYKMPVHTPNTNTEYYMNVKKMHHVPVNTEELKSVDQPKINKGLIPRELLEEKKK